jgi:CTP synthase (UTP-ammonia lyase)
MPDTRAGEIYGRTLVEENFYCNYGLNNAFRETIAQSSLKISGVDEDGDVRIVELPAHPFFVGTLFLPQAASHPGTPHPLITAFLQAALND